MNVEEKIAAVRASNCVHNPTYRRKLRKLYAKCPEAAKILEIEVKSGRITEEEFPIKKVMKIDNINEPILYPTWWEPTFNTPQAFIGCENVLKENILEYKNLTKNEIRKILINESETNTRKYSYEEIEKWKNINKKRIYEMNKKMIEKYNAKSLKNKKNQEETNSDKEYEEIIIPKIKKN